MSPRTTKQFSISMPPELARDALSIARAERRTISELFREALRVYLKPRLREQSEKAQATRKSAVSRRQTIRKNTRKTAR